MKKKTIKFSGLIAFAAIIGLSLAGCATFPEEGPTAAAAGTAAAVGPGPSRWIGSWIGVTEAYTGAEQVLPADVFNRPVVWTFNADGTGIYHGPDGTENIAIRWLEDTPTNRNRLRLRVGTDPIPPSPVGNRPPNIGTILFFTYVIRPGDTAQTRLLGNAAGNVTPGMDIQRVVVGGDPVGTGSPTGTAEFFELLRQFPQYVRVR